MFTIQLFVEKNGPHRIETALARRTWSSFIEKLARTVIRALLFDLDNCLASSREPGEQLLAPVFQAIRAQNRGTLGQFQLAAAFADCWVHAFDWVARRHRFSQAMYDAGFAAFRQLEVQGPMQGYGDLQVLSSLERELFLVTSGFQKLQSSKVRALGIESVFNKVIIDAVDDPVRTSKQVIFATILKDEGLSPEQVLVIGDNPHSEIAAGNRLGIRTIQTLRPEVIRSADASAHVTRLEQLRAHLI